MTITTRDELINALANNSSRFVIDKNNLSNFAVGNLGSYWTTTGNPSAGAAPGTTPIVPTNATTGAINFPNQTAPVTSYLAWMWVSLSVNVSAVEVHDRLATVSGASGIITTAQTTGCAIDLTTTAPSADRFGASDYSDVSWFLEVYTQMGTTSVTATVNVTYNDGTTGNLAAITLGVTPRVGRLYPLITAAAGKFIRGVNSVTLSATTGTAGNFGVTATRQRTVVFSPIANYPNVFDWAQLGLPEIPNDSCLFFIQQATATSLSTIRGQGKLAQG